MSEPTLQLNLEVLRALLRKAEDDMAQARDSYMAQVGRVATLRELVELLERQERGDALQPSRSALDEIQAD